MQIESLAPFALLLTPFLLAFFLEAVALYFFRVGGFWRCVGASVLANLVSLLLVYLAGMHLLSALGYAFNGLDLAPPVLAAFWWLCTVAEGGLLRLLYRRQPAHRLFVASAVMNLCSFLFLIIFILNSR